MATVANFNIDQGSRFSTTINIETTSAGLFELDSYKARGKIRKSYKCSSYTSFSCAISNNSPNQDTITITLSSRQTKALKPGRYVYDVEIFDDATDDVIRIVEGQAEILPSVTQSNPLGEGIEFRYTEENFVPHVMYDPEAHAEAGQQVAYTANTYEEHQEFAALGYVHVYPHGGGGSDAIGAQSATDTISPAAAAEASDTTSNSPGDSGGESSSYY